MIEDTLSYHVLKLMKRTRPVIGPVLTEHGLHPGQEFLLSQLWREDGLTQAELVARLGVEAPTVTKAVQRLERTGFVRREPGRRQRRVFLTEEGRALRRPVERAWRQADRAVTRGLSDVQRTELADLLRRLTVGDLAG